MKRVSDLPARGGIFSGCSCSCVSSLFELECGRRFGTATRANESNKTIRQVAGWALLLPFCNNACNLFSWPAKLWFCDWSALIRFNSVMFSSVHCFTRSSNPSTYSFFLFRESWAEILLRILRLILFNSLSSCFVNG